MAELIALDHGDKYTGVAWFRTPDGNRDPLMRDPTLLKYGWLCYDAQTMDPDEALDRTGRDLLVGKVLYVVYERFRLYPDKADAQISSEFQTSQGIGVTKWQVRNVNARREELGLGCSIGLHAYGAEAKTPAREILRAKGIKSTAKRLGGSAKRIGPGGYDATDAELHGWHFIFEELLNDA